jgi:hypothetical protein
VVLKGYFDGGNQADSLQYDRITLATALGTCEQWCAFELAWKEVLDTHGAYFLHTTDAIGLQKEFSKDKGWTDGRVDALISSCVNVVEQHMVIPGRIIIPGPYGDRLSIAKSGLNIITLTIPLKDYERARKVVPELPNSAAEVCAIDSVGFCFKWGKIIGTEWYHLYFDQNEQFYSHIYNRRRNKKSKKDITLMKKVVALAEVNMRVSPALQVADLFAWCINHVNDVRRDWHKHLNGLPWHGLILDYERLLHPIPWVAKRINSWKLPPHADSSAKRRKPKNGQ